MTENTDSPTQIAIHLGVSLAAHGQNKGSHLRAANILDFAGKDDEAADERRAAAREDEVISNRQAQLEAILTAKDERIAALEDALRRLIAADEAATPHGQYERYNDHFIAREIVAIRKAGLL